MPRAPSGARLCGLSPGICLPSPGPASLAAASGSSMVDCGAMLSRSAVAAWSALSVSASRRAINSCTTPTESTEPGRTVGAIIASLLMVAMGDGPVGPDGASSSSPMGPSSSARMVATSSEVSTSLSWLTSSSMLSSAGLASWVEARCWLAAETLVEFWNCCGAPGGA